MDTVVADQPGETPPGGGGRQQIEGQTGFARAGGTTD
jgi:hypothetical protein